MGSFKSTDNYSAYLPISDALLGNGNGTAKRRSSNAGGVENLDVSSEREVRQKAEIAWLRTYEALNKAVRLIQLTREGAPGDKVVEVNYCSECLVAAPMSDPAWLNYVVHMLCFRLKQMANPLNP